MERVRIRLNRPQKKHAARPLAGAKPACLIPACLMTGGTISALAGTGVWRLFCRLHLEDTREEVAMAEGCSRRTPRVHSRETEPC